MKRDHSFLWGILFLLLAAPVGLPECFPDEPPDPVEFVGDVLFGGSFTDVEVVGGVVYATNGYGLLTFSLTDPETGEEVGLTEVSRVPTPGNANALSIGDTLYAYVADGTDGLRVIDMGSNFLPPREIGSLESLDQALGVTHRRGVVFLAEGEAGLSIVDASTPENPVRIGRIDTEGSSEDVAVSGDVAYVADGIGGLWIVDIDSLAEPREISRYLPGGIVRGVVVRENLAYLAAGTAGLLVVDISDPMAPTLVGSLNTPGSAFRVSLAGDLAFVADLVGGVHVVDISEPTLPSFVASIPTFEEDVLVANAAAGDDAMLYVGDAQGRLLRFDITEPTAPRFVDAYRKEGRINSIRINNVTGFVADRHQGLHVVSFVNPLEPERLQTLDIGGQPQQIAISPNGDYAYVTNVDGVKTIFIEDPANVREVGFNLTPGDAEAVAVSLSANRLFVADGSSGNQTASLRIYDITQPFQPQFLGLFPLGFSDLQGVAAEGVIAVVVSADLVTNFSVIDITDPANPQRIGLTNVGVARGVTIRGTYAFVATDTGLTVVDISNPVLPTIVAEVELAAAGRSVVLQGSTAYVAIGSGGFQLVDVADPRNPIAGQVFNTASFANNADTQLRTGNFLVVGDLYDLAIFRIPPSSDNPKE